MTEAEVREGAAVEAGPLGERTPQERIERLQALLAGRPRSTRTLAALRSPAAPGTSGAPGLANLLLGVALHGADRLRVKQPPTDLEMLLMRVLDKAVPMAEVTQWGGAYRGTVQSTDPGSLVVPQLIASRPVSSGFAMADLAAVFPQLAAEAAAAPNVSLPSAEDFARGAEEEPAFLEAMGKSGFGVSGVARYRDPAAAATAEAAGTAGWRVRMEMDRFYVHKAMGDQGGGKPEVYFTSSASAGGGGRTFISEEFGAVKKGQTRHFDANNRVFVDEQASDAGTLITSIQVWEADQSNAAWYKALQEALYTAIETIERALNNPIGALPDPIPLPATVAWEIGKLFVALMDVLRNDDDLDCHRTIVLTRDDMAMAAVRGEITWRFTGGGDHALTCRYTGEHPVYPTGAIELVTRTHGSTPDQAGPWSAPVPLDWKTTNAPRIASYRGVLHAVFTRVGDNATMWSRYDGRAWTTPVRINQTSSAASVALAVHDDKLHCLHISTSGTHGIHHNWYDGTSWSRTNRIRDWVTPYAPSMAVHNGRLYCAHAGSDGRVHVADYRGGTDWNTPETIRNFYPAHGTPALTSTKGTLMVDHRTDDSSLISLVRNSQDSWIAEPNRGWRSAHGPTAHSHGGYGWLAHAGTDGPAVLAWTRESHQGAWGWSNPPHIVSGGSQHSVWTPTVLAAPGLTVHDGRMYAIYHA
ncbi:hypothetical protein GCM10010232_31080 [Streptomyces amakusaensis]|uniref:Uncharacterized protein n=1 Tax=Streptomyces amakusaensis TaxID=67271 RepID=A0ABW0AED3_9ACTN